MVSSGHFCVRNVHTIYRLPSGGLSNFFRFCVRGVCTLLEGISVSSGHFCVRDIHIIHQVGRFSDFFG